MNYKKTMEVLKELILIHPKYKEELDLAIKTIKNIEKDLGYSSPE